MNAVPASQSSTLTERLDELLQSRGVYLRLNQPRPFNDYCAEYFDGPVVGVEIGVHLGENAVEMFETIGEIQTLHLVDSYNVQNPDPIWDVADDSKRHAIARRRLAPYQSSCEWHILDSDEAADEIGSPVEFVYIDGDHSYEQVLADLQNYWPKVGTGGVIGGHDLDMDSVTKAVWEFSKEIGVPYKVLGGQTTSAVDFLFEKPEVPA